MLKELGRRLNDSEAKRLREIINLEKSRENPNKKIIEENLRYLSKIKLKEELEPELGLMEY